MANPAFSRMCARQSKSRTSLDVVLFFSFFVQVGLTAMRIARDQRVGDLQNYDNASAL
jgi:hypothetical protein